MKRITVLLPAYNEEASLPLLHDKMVKTASENPGYEWEFLIVDDGSTDATHTLLQEFADKVTLVEYDTNKGKGYALKQGFKEARERGYDYAITMDSDDITFKRL